MILSAVKLRVFGMCRDTFLLFFPFSGMFSNSFFDLSSTADVRYEVTGYRGCPFQKIISSRPNVDKNRKIVLTLKLILP